MGQSRTPRTREAGRQPGCDPIDDTPPFLALGGAAAQRVLRQRGIVVTVRPDEGVTIVASGTVSVPANARTFRFRRVTRAIAAGTTARIKLRLSKPALKAIGSALRRGKKLRAVVRVAASDAGGNRRSSTRRVRLRR